MKTYAHPSTDWSLVHRLLAGNASPARQAILTNLHWLRRKLMDRGGELMLVSERDVTNRVVGVAGLSHDSSAVVVHFYFVVEGYEGTAALPGLYRMIAEYAKRHRASWVRIPVFEQFSLPTEHELFARISTANLPGPWGDGEMVRTYSVPLDTFVTLT